MPAEYAIRYATGPDGSPAWNQLPGGSNDAFRFKTNTDVAEDLNDPIPIPSGGFNYSFWVSLTLYITGNPTYTQVDNIRHYSDGTIGWTLGTDGGLMVHQKSGENRDTGTHGLTDAQYFQSQGVAGASGDELTAANHSALIDATTPYVDLSGGAVYYYAGSPQIVDTTAYSGSPGPENTLHLVLQVKCDTAALGASQGLQTGETLTFLADEI